MNKLSPSTQQSLLCLIQTQELEGVKEVINQQVGLKVKANASLFSALGHPKRNKWFRFIFHHHRIRVPYDFVIK